MSNATTLFHGGAYEITKASEPQAGIVVQVFDMEEDASSVAPMTPAEWDAFVAAGDRALGRKPARDFPPGVVRRARPSTDAEIVAWMADLYRDDTPIAEAMERAALAMVREAGPTVPRAAVEALRDTILGWEKAALPGSYEDGRAQGLLDVVAVIDTMLGTKEPGHADD